MFSVIQFTSAIPCGNYVIIAKFDRSGHIGLLSL